MLYLGVDPLPLLLRGKKGKHFWQEPGVIRGGGSCLGPQFHGGFLTRGLQSKLVDFPICFFNPNFFVSIAVPGSPLNTLTKMSQHSLQFFWIVVLALVSSLPPGFVWNHNSPRWRFRTSVSQVSTKPGRIRVGSLRKNPRRLGVSEKEFSTWYWVSSRNQ